MLDRRCIYIKKPLLYFGAGVAVGLFFPFLPIIATAALITVGAAGFLNSH